MPIRSATPADAARLAALYAHHVVHGTATYEIDPPDADEFAARLRRVQTAHWPWLVAEDGQQAVLGYAFAAQFRDRQAYRFTCENSIYIRHDRRGEGIGRALLSALIEAAAVAGFRQMIAVIGGANPASVALHAALGFAHAGTLRANGRKAGRWLDTVYMQFPLGAGSTTPPEDELAQ